MRHEHGVAPGIELARVELPDRVLIERGSDRVVAEERIVFEDDLQFTGINVVFDERRNRGSHSDPLHAADFYRLAERTLIVRPVCERDGSVGIADVRIAAGLHILDIHRDGRRSCRCGRTASAREPNHGECANDDAGDDNGCGDE